MARPPEGAPGLMPSLLDRIVDPDSMGSGASRGYGIAQMRDAVRRDLEALFNTHDSSPSVVPEAFREVRRSIVAYGLADLSWISTRAGFRREDLGGLVEDVIARHEPRLRDVRVAVSADGGPGGADNRVRLHIEARLNVDPAPEVEFETILELSTGQASIRPGLT